MPLEALPPDPNNFYKYLILEDTSSNTKQKWCDRHTEMEWMPNGEDRRYVKCVKEGDVVAQKLRYITSDEEKKKATDWIL